MQWPWLNACLTLTGSDFTKRRLGARHADRRYNRTVYLAENLFDAIDDQDNSRIEFTEALKRGIGGEGLADLRSCTWRRPLGGRSATITPSVRCPRI